MAEQRKKCRWAVLMVSLICFLIGGGQLTAGAEEIETEAETMPPSYTAIGDSLPPEVAELLPPDLFSPDMDRVLAAAGEMGEFSYAVQTVLQAMGLRLPDAVRLLAALVGLILAAAMLRQMKGALGGRGGETVGFCIRLSVYAAIVVQCVGALKVVSRCLAELQNLTSALLPAMGTLYAIGGNIGQAAVNEEILMLFLRLCQYVSAAVVPPVAGVCMALSLLEAFGSRLTLAPLGDMVKKGFTWTLTFLLFLLSLALSAQSVLASRADTLQMRGVRYAVVNLIPVVGGAVAGTMGTMAASVGMLRGVCGVCGIFLIALLLLPTLLELLLFRWMFHIASMVSTVLSCDGEARLLKEVASLYGYLSAAVTVSAVLVLFALTLFTHSAVALAA